MLRMAGRVQLAPSSPSACGPPAGVRSAPRWRALLTATILVLLVASVLHEQAIGGRSAVASASARPRTLLRPRLLSLPLAAQGPVSGALGDESAAYRVGIARDGFGTANPAQHLSTTFTSSGVSVSTGPAHVGLRLSAVGDGSALEPVAHVAPHARGNRVLYSHPGVGEWYANGPLGIEQGFTVSRAPAGRAGGPLTLSMALSGNTHPRLTSGGQSLLLSDAGRDVLRYGGLAVTDARGHGLHSWLQLAGSRLLLRINAAGARYPVRIDPLIQSTELTAEDGQAGDFFGAAVAFSGNMIVVGAESHEVGSNPNQGAVYVFEKQGSSWTQTAELTASDGALDTGLGSSVAVSGNTIVAGASLREVETHAEQGTVYVFEKSGPDWTQVAELTASDGAYDDKLGTSVAMEDGIIVAGAPNHKVGSNQHQGAAYVFEKPAGGWKDGTQTAELTASNGVAANELGTAVAIEGETIVAGAPNYRSDVTTAGSVYVFEKPAGGWKTGTQTAELTASDGVVDDALGLSVAISGDTIVAGAPFHKTGSTHGAVYVFEKPPAGWKDGIQTAELTPSDGDEEHSFGFSVAMSQSTIFVGAPASLGAGELYLFQRPAAGWENATQARVFPAPAGGGAGADVGWSVAMSEGIFLSGELLRQVGSHVRQGAVFLFTAEASKPAVVTGTTASVGQTSVTVNGTVNPDGGEVSTCKFEYGASASYGSNMPCSQSPGSGTSPVAVSAALTDLSPGATYHYRLVAANSSGLSEGADQTFTAASAGSGTSTTTTTSATTGTTSSATTPGIASTPKAIEEVLLGCSGSQLVLNDVFIQGGHVAISGSAAKSLVGKKVKILFDERKQVAMATVGTDGQFATTAPLPSAKLQNSLASRYRAEVGKLRSLNLKLTRRLRLEPPKASGMTVTLSGQVTLPLTKPIAPIAVEEQLECGKATIVKSSTPAASGRFHITVTVPAGAKAGIFRLKSKVAANKHATRHGFATYSLPLPVALS